MCDRYGKHEWAQKALLARRLVEAGVSFVTIDLSNHRASGTWDTHGDKFPPYGGIVSGLKPLLPVFDHLYSTLITDLGERGLLDEVLVIAMGEFGRSPQRGVSTSGNSNSADGRDHWPYCFTACLAGAGIGRGVVYGESDETASAPVINPVHPRALLATIYHAMGLDPRQMVLNHLNQPREMVKGDAVTDLFV